MAVVAATEYVATTELRDGETIYHIGDRVPAEICARWNNFGTMLMTGQLVPAPPAGGIPSEPDPAAKPAKAKVGRE